jgi:hypothetical protein
MPAGTEPTWEPRAPRPIGVRAANPERSQPPRSEHAEPEEVIIAGATRRHR